MTAPADQNVGSLPFRPDIEGLRGVAIALVVAYHANVPGFSGGYIGVDVFFVLSGYLITSLLMRELRETGRVRLTNFYARRARRLLPAAALVFLVTVLAAFWAYSPIEHRTLALSAFSTAGYFSNLFFTRTIADYFGPGAAGNPFLHTWSLSVEEQFYLVWPLLLVLLFSGTGSGSRDKGERRVAAAMAAVFVLSLALCIWLTAKVQTYAFFLSPARAWEFALGGLASLLPARAGKAWTVAAILAMFAIVAAAATMDDNTLFPGYAALVPAFATAVMLHAGRAGQLAGIGHFLNSRPMQRLGRVSYSWYLWHWPFLALPLAFTPQLNLGQRLGLLLISLLFAQASFRWLEKPVRDHPTLKRRPVYCIAMIAAFALLGVFVAVLQPRLSFAGANADRHRFFQAGKADGHPLRRQGCVAKVPETKVKSCVFGEEKSSNTVVLMGDSHAAQWFNAVLHFAEQENWRLITMIKAACPYVDIRFVYPSLKREFTECEKWRAAALDEIGKIKPQAVIVTSSGVYNTGPEEWRRGAENSFRRLGEASAHVIHLRDSPQPRFDVPICLSRARWHGDQSHEDDCMFPREKAAGEAIFAAERTAAQKFANVATIDLTDLICPDPICPVQTESTVMYQDGNHLTGSFVASLAGPLAIRIHDAIEATRHPTAAVPD